MANYQIFKSEHCLNSYIIWAMCCITGSWCICLDWGCFWSCWKNTKLFYARSPFWNPFCAEDHCAGGMCMFWSFGALKLNFNKGYNLFTTLLIDNGFHFTSFWWCYWHYFSWRNRKLWLCYPNCCIPKWISTSRTFMCTRVTLFLVITSEAECYCYILQNFCILGKTAI